MNEPRRYITVGGCKPGVRVELQPGQTSIKIPFVQNEDRVTFKGENDPIPVPWYLLSLKELEGYRLRGEQPPGMPNIKHAVYSIEDGSLQPESRGGTE